MSGGRSRARGLRCSDRDDVRVRPSYRSNQRAARHCRGLEPSEARLTVYQGTKPAHDAEPLCQASWPRRASGARAPKDVGGSFGIKVHTYADEMATVALSNLLERPIKFVADRIESFVTDIHARDHRVKAKIGVKNDGTVTALEIDDLTGIGPYSVYPRTSGIEANQIVNLVGGPDMPELPSASARRIPEQERNVPIPRGRPPDCRGGHRRPGRARCRQDRHGSA